MVEGGVPIGSLGNGEAVWPTDMSYVEVPPQASALYALVYTHPETGRAELYLGRCRNAYIDGDRFGWSHEWRRGDLMLWDNRCTIHPRDAFNPAARRVMHRTQITGTGRPA